MSQERQKAKPFANPTSTTASVASVNTTVPNVAATLEKLEGKVKVIHGANDDTFDGLVGQKVSTVRASLVDAFNIPGDALALVNGNQVDNNYVLQQSDVLEFIKQAGVKGR